MKAARGPSISMVMFRKGCCSPLWCGGTAHPGIGGRDGTWVFDRGAVQVSAKTCGPEGPRMKGSASGVLESVSSSPCCFGVGAGGLPPEPPQPLGGDQPCQPG